MIKRIQQATPTAVRSREEQFVSRSSTKIWQEKASSDNPYIADQSYCHGYDLLELMSKRGFADVLYLLFRGELPTSSQSEMLETLMIALINPGPRHEAVRAAATAAVSKADPVHLLPIGLSVLGGAYLGGGEVVDTMRFLRRSARKSSALAAEDMLALHPRPPEGDWRVAPGFGTRFGSADLLSSNIAERLCELPGAGRYLDWARSFVSELKPSGAAWLPPSVAAATLMDLGFSTRGGGGLFQLLSAPGILAHGLELAGKPITAMPFPDNDHYVIER